MLPLIAWFFKILNPAYVPKNGKGQGATGRSDTITQAKNSTVQEGKPAAKFAQLAKSAKSAFSTQGNKAVPEYAGDYKALPSYIDATYFDWVAGKEEDNVIKEDAFERKIIEYLDVVAESEHAGSNLIPRVPTVMVQLLKRMHEENVSGAELSRIITKDVVLLAAILNEVNSSFYNKSEKITELSQAILLLGHNRLRMVLAKLSFTPIFNAQLGPYTKVTAAKIWEESQKRALVCYLLAKIQQVDPFMAFLAGLMQDVGLMVALRVFDRSSGNAALPTSSEFRRAFQQKSLVLSTRIGQIWALPDVVIKAIESQGPDKTAPVRAPLASVLDRADLLSKICILINQEQINLDMERVRVILTDAETDCLFTMLEGQVSVATIM